MLSISKLSSSSQAASYYSYADYVTKGKDLEDVSSTWVGEGAKNLGLEGTVELERFKSLLEGKIDPNTELGTQRNGEWQHTPGWDLTFSAPKSVSVLALIGGDSRIIQAHHDSVKTLTQLIEGDYLSGRKNEGKAGVSKVDLKDMVGSVFTHTTSRDLDPQLHSHFVLMNMGKDEHGKFKSIQSLPIFEDKMFLGQIYRNELSSRLMELGYQLEFDVDKGTFEVQGVPKEVIKEFSQRRQEIEKAAEEYGYEGGKQMEKATLRSRSAKKDRDRESILADWDERSLSHGFNAGDLVSSTNGRQIVPPNSPEGLVNADAMNTVKIAIEFLGHYESVFSEKDILDQALKISKGGVRYEYVKKCLADEIKQKKVVPSKHLEGHLTTEKAVKREMYILDLVDHGREKEQPLGSEKQIQSAIETSGFTDGQELAFEKLMSSKDRYSALQGFAGVGKTYMLKKLMEVSELNGYTVRGLAPYGTQQRALESDTGFESNTLKSHLMGLETGKIKPEGKELWVLDEAGVVNTKDIADLFTHAHRNQSRVLLVGDRLQTKAIEAGNPFNLFLNKGIDYAVNSEIIRQKNNLELKSSIYDVIDRKVKSSFKKLDKSFVEIENNEDRLQAIVGDYLGKVDKDFMNVALIAPDNESRAKVNEYVREGLKQTGRLDKKDVSVTNMKPSKIDGPKKKYAFSYKKGQYVRFNRAYKSLEVKAGEYYRVEGVQGENVTLSVDGKSVEWNPSKVAGGDLATTTYVEEAKKYSKGDLIRWKDKTTSIGLKNGDSAVIKSIDDKKMSLLVNGKDPIDVDLKDRSMRHFEHFYAQTVNSVQAQTFGEALMLAESWRRNLVNQSSFYVGISRAKENVSLYTDNKSELEGAIEKRLGEKLNGHDILTQFQLNDIESTRNRSEVMALLNPPPKELEGHSDLASPSKGIKVSGDFDYVYGYSNYVKSKKLEQSSQGTKEDDKQRNSSRDKQLEF